ncbi:MAG TPA: hypothetical protein VMD29_14250, partial [Terracidiphilus sp.]|nr:hypothetical protein [Terracidiphilus sp.]
MGKLATSRSVFKRHLLVHWKEWEADKHWPYMVCQFATLAVVLWWIRRDCLPWPGVAVALIAILAALMSVEQGMKGRHKAVYFVLMAALLVTEFRAMRKDRDDSEQKQQAFFAQQKAGFEAISKQSDQNFQSTTKQAQHDFEVTAKGLESAYSQSQIGFTATLGGISKSIDTMTGGTSYLWMSCDPKYNTLFFIHKGNYTVYRALVHIVNLDSIPLDLNGTTFELQDLTKGHAVDRPAPSGLFSNPDRIDLNIFFQSLNGEWVESLRERRIDNQWHSFMRIQGYFYSTNKSGILC